MAKPGRPKKPVVIKSTIPEVMWEQIREMHNKNFSALSIYNHLEVAYNKTVAIGAIRRLVRQFDKQLKEQEIPELKPIEEAKLPPIDKANYIGYVKEKLLECFQLAVHEKNTGNISVFSDRLIRIYGIEKPLDTVSSIAKDTDWGKEAMTKELAALAKKAMATN